MSISQMSWHNENSEKYVKSSEVWLLPPLERCHGKGEFSQWNLGCSSPVEGIFGVQEHTMRSAAATDPKTPLNCHSPSLYIPWYPSKCLPQLQGMKQSWHGLKQAPLNVTRVSEVQQGTPLNQPFYRGNLLAYPPSAPPLPITGYQASFLLCGWRARPNSTLLSLVGVGLMPRWGQGAGPQSKPYGYYCRKFASCFLFTWPPIRRVPFEGSLPHCIFSSSFPVCLQTHMLTVIHTSSCSYCVAPQQFQDPQRIIGC